MDLPVRAHHLEVVKLKLAGEHFPLSISLREQILAAYTPQPGPGTGPAPETGQLLESLARCDDLDTSLPEAISRHLEATGKTAALTVEQQAILAWLEKAYQDWTSRYSLAEPLADAVKKMRPLAAGLALADPVFMQPGAHPLHRLLDQIVASAIGWEPETARSESLRNLIATTTEEALAWLVDRDIDLPTVCDTFIRDSERECTRSSRMAQRSVEAEQGRVRSSWARRIAAGMINTCLARHPLPPAIGDFMKGPWYSSAQLVLLKFGNGSRQWAAMSETTLTLLDSLQPIESVSPERKQELFEIVTTIPKEIRRWLLSLHHDSDAIEEAVGLVEFAHLRILRQQELEVETIAPIETGEGETKSSEHAERLCAIKPGQWFMISQPEKPAQRVRLSLNLDTHQQVLFTDHAGLKALQISYAEFEDLLAQRMVKKLAHEASFSECLARAAGVDSVETLQQLMVSAGAGTSA